MKETSIHPKATPPGQPWDLADQRAIGGQERLRAARTNKPRMTQQITHPPFTNEAILTFRDAAAQAELTAAIAAERKKCGTAYPLIIGGETQTAASSFASHNPARPQEILGNIASASLAQAMQALAVAQSAFTTWSRVAPADRAAILFRAAAKIRAERARFNAILVLEVGKPWIEADADTAEAIDFHEFYAREALRYADPPPLTPLAGEQNRLRYIPLGVGLVIPPWNFAFAIMAGMTAAALVTGNTVIVKPSSDSPIIAHAFVELLHEVGLPPGVVNFVPGSSREIGDPLVADARTRFISFTGSKTVGLHINALAAQTAPGQIWIKRVIAEMGGKDAIVVADDADLPAAADAIVAAAFGFSGQKCSACSRLIIDKRVYAEVLELVVERTKRLRIGDPSEVATQVGPVINAAARDSIMRYIGQGSAGGRLVAGGQALEREGYFIEPTIIADCKPDAVIVREEIFGPVMAVVQADGFDDALRLANDSEYGLTGAIFTADRERVNRAMNEFHVGNLYINRKCTGALVGVHPFGGFNMSGTDSKAGGYDYLGLFMQAKLISEKIT